MPVREIGLEFPAAGKSTRQSFQRQSPFTSTQMQNMRAIDAEEQKRRGGTRPWLSRQFAEKLGSGNPINLINELRTTRVSGSLVFLDLLDDATNWDAASWTSGLPDFTDGSALAVQIDTRGAMLKTASIPSMNQTASRKISAFIRPGGSWVDDMEVWLHGNMDNTTPVKADSIECQLKFENKFETEVDARITIWINGTPREQLTFTYIVNESEEQATGWFSLTIEPNRATVVWDTELRRHELVGDFPTPTVAGDAAGFTLVTPSGAIQKVDTFRIDYTGSALTFPPEIIVAASNGQLYAENPKGTMATVSTNITLETDPIQSVERNGKLYIADFAVPRFERLTKNSRATLAANGTLTDLDGTFDTAGDTFVIAGGDVLEITDATNGVGTVVLQWYKVTTVTSGTVLVITQLDGTALTTNTATALAYRIVPGLKVYDTSTSPDAVTLWVATAGVLPYGARLISKFRTAIILSGDPNNPGWWWMGNEIDPNDWFQSATNVRGPVFGTSVAEDFASSIGAPLTALVRYTKDYHIMATSQDMLIMRGHPLQGGGVGVISGTIGIISPWAHAVTDDNVLYFLSQNGVYRLTEQEATVLEEPTAVSRETLPLELVDIDVAVNEVFFVNDPKRAGIYIYVTPKSVGASKIFYLDLFTGGFFPDTLADGHQPLSAVYSGANNEVFIGCRDGFIRNYDESVKSDDGTAQEANVDIGPFRIDNGRFAMADSVEIELDDGSDDVTWEFRTGESPEAAVKATALTTGTASAGRNYLQSIRQSGKWGVLRLKTTTASAWSLERIRLRVHKGAASRKF